MNPAFSIQRRDETIFDDFERLADKMAEAGGVFSALVHGSGPAEANIERLRLIEREADAITCSIFLKTHATYVSPLEHSDIYRLAQRMDDVIDLIATSADRFEIYRIEPPAFEFGNMALALNAAISGIKKSVYALRSRKNYKTIREKCGEIYELRRKSRDVLCDSLLSLFEKIRDAVELFKRKDILERLEKAVDATRDIALILEGVVLKG